MLNGKWTVVTPIVTRDLIFNFKVKGSTLTGSIKDGNRTLQITNGKINDKNFSFKVLIRTTRGNIPVFIQGKLDDATHISGTIKCKLGSLKYTAVKN